MTAFGQGPDPLVAMAGKAAELLMAQLDAAELLATKAGGASSAAEARDFAQASLFMAQAVITLDPNRLQGGDTPQARKASVPTPPPIADGNKDGVIGSKKP